MLKKHKDSITKNFSLLMETCEVKDLLDKLISKNIFTEEEIKQLFSSDDENHNKRLFFFGIQKKGPTAFESLIQSLTETGQMKVAAVLEKNSGIVPFIFPPKQDAINHQIGQNYNFNMTPLTVSVTLSNKFYDSTEVNRSTPFYNTRSKNRGSVLIINNYQFNNDKYEYRTGAQVDEQNCKELFEQMGLNVELHSNLTAKDMKKKYQEFAHRKLGGDVCIIITMSHGILNAANQVCIVGIDEGLVTVCYMEEIFNNANCELYRNKPKIFLFQICRGSEIDLPYFLPTTQTDGQVIKSVKSDKKPQTVPVRRVDDILIGNSTLIGYKAHRDMARGSWYIESICNVFMKNAHNTAVDDMLIQVDQGIKNKMSHMYGMQTSDTSNRGFKKCYLHPGIYESNGKLMKFHDSSV